ncbi:Uncharacterised protein [Serratia marcescens]|nr:Uncharacterised protein [Serratia marcescens]CVA90991.1 Uncharacterised protein [Serratia marcescens]CVB31493.1 Uncharacterised protein [Serratia marcescens]CVB56044.1 Uncharacterised protein [Serratia marcescens]CVB92228.1 Uncharacterised protein [Serratia marcescens]
MKAINASEFNEKYKVGSMFIYQSCPILRGGPIVKTVGPARDFKVSGTVVEINQEPYFVKITALTAA